MNDLNKREALARIKQKRKHPYKHKKGSFTLTASFKNDTIDWHRIRTVGALVEHATQKQIAYAMNCSVGTVQKMVRIHYANPVD